MRHALATKNGSRMWQFPVSLFIKSAIQSPREEPFDWFSATRIYTIGFTLHFFEKYAAVNCNDSKKLNAWQLWVVQILEFDRTVERSCSWEFRLSSSINYCTLFLDDNFESCWLHMPADGVRALFPSPDDDGSYHLPTTSIFNVSLFEFWFCWTYSRAVKWMVFVAPADMRTRSKGRRSERANRARQMTPTKKT